MKPDESATPNLWFGNPPSELIRGAMMPHESDLPTVPTPQPWHPPLPSELAPLIPQVRFSHLLGHGGMGAVYMGVQLSLDRPVAVKLLRPGLSMEQDFVSRFEREARTLASLHHPGIVTVHDSGGTAEGHLYFIMEYVDGSTLERCIPKVGLEEPECLRLLLEICDALDYAHQRGVIHRDIKPANILITQEGHAKLVDFGLARPMAATSGGMTSLTVMGTPGYMAPEQCMGRADERSDIYALGMTACRLLTGRLAMEPGKADVVAALARLRMGSSILAALEENPQQRPPSVDAFKKELLQAMNPPAVPARKPSSPARARTRGGRKRQPTFRPAWLALVLPVLAVGAGLYFWKNDAPKEIVAPTEMPPPTPPAEMEKEAPVMVTKSAVMPTEESPAPDSTPAEPPSPPSAAAVVAKNDLGSRLQALLSQRCGECHGSEAVKPKEFQIIDDLALLRESEYVRLDDPEKSDLYVSVQNSSMPLRTQADREANRQAVSFDDDELALVLEWLQAGAPLPGTSDTEAVPPAPEKPRVEPRTEVAMATEFRAALEDLQSLPLEEQAGTRYISLASAHNNFTEVSAAQLDLMRQGVRKLLNSLSTRPNLARFAEVGPEKVLFRLRLHDLGWDAALWERLASFYPLAVETVLSPLFSDACHTHAPILRADWLAATATRAPLYNELLRLPATQQELEAKLGVEVFKNLASGHALRTGFTRSGVSRHNRLVERHELGSWQGGYWLSYDFKESGGRASLHANPLGPKAAHLLGGERAFEHAGGEIVFSLPNGLNGYYVSDVDGLRLDGAVPTEIVSDRTNITGRAEVSNALACIICHDQGIKPLPRDEVRALAASFASDEQRLIERLYPPQAGMEEVEKQDTVRFLTAMREAGVTTQGGAEPVGLLFKSYDRTVSHAQAAAEVGLALDEFSRRLAEQHQLFDVRTLLEGEGMSREHFLDRFPDVIARLGLGRHRRATAQEPSPAAPADATPRPVPSHPIAVRLHTDKPSYRAGEELRVSVQASLAGHLRLYYQDAAGSITLLFPNALMPDDRIPGGGQPFTLLPARSQADSAREVAVFVTGPPFGKERLVAIVSDTPFTDDPLRFTNAENPFWDAGRSGMESLISKAVRLIARPSAAPVPSHATATPITSSHPAVSSRPSRGMDRVELLTFP